MERLILHIDLDAFYAAVEQRDRPEWRGLPVVVGAAPGGRGVVATCSYEARRFGVHSAMPISEASRRLPQETVYVRPDMARYAQVSRQVMQALTALSPVIEQISIDEAYVDVSGLERLIGTPTRIGHRAKALIRDAVGLTSSVGIGPNRLIAKLASEHRKPDGLTVVPASAVAAFLDPLPLTVLRGVGAKTAPRLQQLGLHSVADVRRLPLTALRRAVGPRAGTELHRQAHGLADDRVYPETSRKSISKETTFGTDVTDPAVLQETLRWAAQEVGYLARRAGRAGPVLTLKIRFRGFETHTRSRTLAVPSADDRVLFEAARELYAAGCRRDGWSDRPVRLIGLGISGWESSDANGDTGRQLDLFADQTLPAQDPAEDELNAALDAIRERFGKGSVQRGLPRERRPTSESPRKDRT